MLPSTSTVFIKKYLQVIVMEWSSFDCEELGEQDENDIDTNVESSSNESKSKRKDPRRIIEIINEQKQLSMELREFTD